jgi:hypothetical protein
MAAIILNEAQANSRDPSIPDVGNAAAHAETDEFGGQYVVWLGTCDERRVCIWVNCHEIARISGHNTIFPTPEDLRKLRPHLVRYFEEREFPSKNLEKIFVEKGDIGSVIP